MSDPIWEEYIKLFEGQRTVDHNPMDDIRYTIQRDNDRREKQVHTALQTTYDISKQQTQQKRYY